MIEELKQSISGGGVKVVYRGVVSAAGNVTLPATVNPDKTVVHSVSKGSAGYVAARGSFTARGNIMVGVKNTGTDGTQTYISNALGNSTYMNNSTTYLSAFAVAGQVLGLNNSKPTYISIENGVISGGSTNLTVKEYSARLIDENTIYCDGPVEWQVIEYN